VQVIDLETEKVVADFPDTPGVHGVAIAPAAHLAFTSNGQNNSVSVFDLTTNKKIADVKAGTGPDAIAFDEASQQVMAFNHRGGTITFITIDADKKFPTHDLEVGGTLEYAAFDGAGHGFVNVEDKNEVVEFDTKAMKVLNHWPIEGGEGPTGLAIDAKNNRLFIGCSQSQKLAVMDSTNGKILAMLPIGKGCDGVAFDPETGEAFAACGDGTIPVAKETSAGKFEITQTIQSKRGARTIAIDPKTHMLYLPTAEFEEAQQGKRPAMKPGTFQIVVIGK
jgi:YVTN family beta-propeller protein